LRRIGKNHASDEPVILCAEEVSREFDDHGSRVAALNRVSFTVARAGVTGLVGADGAGKTTFIRIAAGLLVPTSGKMSLLGLDSAADSLEIQSRVGYMPQKFGLYQDLTVSENMNLYADLQGVPMAQRSRRYEQLLTMTDLAAYTKRRAGALSGGMKQKLGLACALIKTPELLLLDEPTVGVDPVSRRELWKIVYKLVEEDGIGVLVSTAYLDEAERCSHVVVLHQGRLLAEGVPKDFSSKMKNRVSLVTAEKSGQLRRIYTCVAGEEGIVDATIRSGRVRVVREDESAGRLKQLLNGAKVQIKTTEPCFEDTFMALIPHNRDHLKTAGEAGDSLFFRKAGGDGEVVVHTRDLSRRFGDFEAVKKLNFSVKQGEIFGLLGPNGAGKSTTFRMLCGLLPASSGDIQVAGRNLLKSRAKARARLGYMAQQFSLYGQLSVKENLSFFGRVYGLDNKNLKKRIDWAYSEFGLGRLRNKAAVDLPGGYKQRLAMAAALLHEPDILFLDEPTSGVDPFARREFWLRINGFAEQGITVVVTTHFMEEAEYCDRMLIMSRGETLALGTPQEIRNLAVSAENKYPTMDDAFIALAEGNVRNAPDQPDSTGRQDRDPGGKP
jgi:ABC-2 type transport system ATP-binding protein